jgi:hypothetical protein
VDEWKPLSTGIHLDRHTCGPAKIRIDSDYVLTPATTRGRDIALMVRAYKKA